MGLFDSLFGKKKTPAELLRENKRALNRAIRELDREHNRLEIQEKKTIADIRRAAKTGQMDSVRAMARDLVRTRQGQKKFVMMRANIQAISLKIQGLTSQDAMAQVMCSVTKTMESMNSQLDLPEIQKIMSEFERQSEIMGMKEEMMDGALDDVIGDDDEEKETESVVQQVLDELGIQIGDKLNRLETIKDNLNVQEEKEKAKIRVAAMETASDSELQSRINRLIQR